MLSIYLSHLALRLVLAKMLGSAVPISGRALVARGGAREMTNLSQPLLTDLKMLRNVSTNPTTTPDLTLISLQLSHLLLSADTIKMVSSTAL